MTDAGRPQSLLAFWFGDARRDPDRIGERMGLWFKPTAADDAAVGERFGPIMQRAASGQLTDWMPLPAGRLALILSLDQAPRVIFRRQAEAFAHDGQALALALAGIDAGIDRGLGLAERAFFYMPLQHSEDPLVQVLSVRQHEALAKDHPKHAGLAEGFLKHAQDHAAIIERFGRYPHRNAALGRESTESELAYLEKGPRFGQ